MKESVPMIRFVIFHEGGCFYVFLMLLDAIIGRSLMNHGDRYMKFYAKTITIFSPIEVYLCSFGNYPQFLIDFKSESCLKIIPNNTSLPVRYPVTKSEVSYRDLQ